MITQEGPNIHLVHGIDKKRHSGSRYKNIAFNLSEGHVLIGKAREELSFCHKLKLSNPYIFTI